jgi:hypothetical protein
VKGRLEYDCSEYASDNGCEGQPSVVPVYDLGEMPGGRPGAPGVDAAKALQRRQLEQARPGQPSRTGRSPRAWEAHGRCWRPWREGHYAATAHAVDEAADLAAAYAAPYASSALGDASILLPGWRKQPAWMPGVQGVMVRDFCRNRFHWPTSRPPWNRISRVLNAAAMIPGRKRLRPCQFVVRA